MRELYHYTTGNMYNKKIGLQLQYRIINNFEGTFQYRETDGFVIPGIENNIFLENTHRYNKNLCTSK